MDHEVAFQREETADGASLQDKEEQGRGVCRIFHVQLGGHLLDRGIQLKSERKERDRVDQEKRTNCGYGRRNLNPCRNIASGDAFCRVAGEPVDTFVFGMAGMALHPMPLYLMLRANIDQLMPQLGISHGFLAGIQPAAFLPAVHPLRDAFDQIFAVGEKIDMTGLYQGGKTADRGSHLHPVVGRIGFAAGYFLFVRTHPQQDAPAARTGVSLAGAIGKKFDPFHRKAL